MKKTIQTMALVFLVGISIYIISPSADKAVAYNSGDVSSGYSSENNSDEYSNEFVKSKPIDIQSSVKKSRNENSFLSQNNFTQENRVSKSSDNPFKTNPHKTNRQEEDIDNDNNTHQNTEDEPTINKASYFSQYTEQKSSSILTSASNHKKQGSVDYTSTEINSVKNTDVENLDNNPDAADEYQNDTQAEYFSDTELHKNDARCSVYGQPNEYQKLILSQMGCDIES